MAWLTPALRAVPAFALAACSESATEPVPPQVIAAMSVGDGGPVIGVAAEKLLESAFVAEGFPCGVVFAGTTDSHVVNTPNGKNVKLVCHGFAPNPEGKALKFTADDFVGATCGIPGPLGGATSDWRLLWSGEGDLSLICTL